MKDAEAFVPNCVARKLTKIHCDALSNPIFGEDTVGRSVMDAVSQQRGLENKLAILKSTIVQAYTVIKSKQQYILIFLQRSL
jgi:hypothetical protein